MEINKKYHDSLVVGGTAEENLTKAISSLTAAGFKKVQRQAPFLRVTADWKPIVGTFFGDITIDFEPIETNTRVTITIVAAVDNAYALFSSPGERIKGKFLEEFTKVSVVPSSDAGDLASRLGRLDNLLAQGLISDLEHREARLKILEGA